MKIINLVLALMFIVFAFLQINDADPVLWILIYGAMAVICVLAAFRIFSKVALVILLLAYAAYSLVFIDGAQEWMAQEDKSILFDDLAKMQYPFIEEGREFLGLLICIIVLIAYLAVSFRKRSGA